MCDGTDRKGSVGHRKKGKENGKREPEGGIQGKGNQREVINSQTICT